MEAEEESFHEAAVEIARLCAHRDELKAERDRLKEVSAGLLVALKKAEAFYGPDHPSIIWQEVRAAIAHAEEK